MAAKIGVRFPEATWFLLLIRPDSQSGSKLIIIVSLFSDSRNREFKRKMSRPAGMACPGLATGLTAHDPLNSRIERTYSSSWFLICIIYLKLLMERRQDYKPQFQEIEDLLIKAVTADDDVLKKRRSVIDAL